MSISEPTRADEGRPRPPPQDQLDLATLAEKVYRLLREELRLERARGGASDVPRRG